MSVIPKRGDTVPAPHLLRTLALRLGHPYEFLAPSRAARSRLAHLRCMKTKKSKKSKPSVGAASSPAHSLAGVLSLTELCAQLRVSPQTLYDLRSQGRGPRGFRVGRELRFRASEVEAWLSRREQEDEQRHRHPGR